MHLPRAAVVALLCTLAVWPLAARAQTSAVIPASPPPKQEPLRRFSFGAGLGLVGYGLQGGSLGGAGFANGILTGQSGVTPVGTALVEIACIRALRISLGANASYLRRDIDDGFASAGNAGPAKTTSFGVGLGPRWVFNPGGVVEISTLLTLGAHRYTSEARTGSTVTSNVGGESLFRVQTTDSSGFGIDARAGIVLEYELMKRLSLRFDNQLVRAGYDWYRTRIGSTTEGEQDIATKTSSTQVSVDFGWAPFLMLRLEV